VIVDLEEAEVTTGISVGAEVGVDAGPNVEDAVDAGPDAVEFPIISSVIFLSAKTPPDAKS